MSITVDEFVLFCERTIGGMVATLDRLDDTTVNALPPLPEPNSAFQLVTHALGACEWWTAHVVCGHPSARERAAAATARLRHLAPELAAATDLAVEARTETPLAAEWTVGTALLHTYEELAQHLGHLEITVDLVAD